MFLFGTMKRKFMKQLPFSNEVSLVMKLPFYSTGHLKSHLCTANNKFEKKKKFKRNDF